MLRLFFAILISVFVHVNVGVDVEIGVPIDVDADVGVDVDVNVDIVKIKANGHVNGHANFNINFSVLHAGETGVTLERGDAAPTDANRSRLARTIYFHNFENIRDPDSGVLLPESAALNPEDWPDFWEPVRAVGFPEYLIPSVRVVPDQSNVIPGAYRDLPNHALALAFDGTRIGIRTRTPVPIDPSLAYEYSLFLKDDGLVGARIRTGVDWMRVDSASTAVLRSDEIPGLAPGQADWPVKPFATLINDPPPRANAARLFVIIDRDPEKVGGAYHGSLSVDNISLKPLPKITIGAPRPASGSASGQNDGYVIPVEYHGLFDNIPDAENPGYFKGNRYARRVEITDVSGLPVMLPANRSRRVLRTEDGSTVEEIPFPRDKLGVYYFNIRLYDAEDSLLADVIRSVAVMRPPQDRTAGSSVRATKPVFGVSAGVVPDAILGRAGVLQTMLERSGAKVTKIIPWRDGYAAPGDNAGYYASLVEEIRHLRSGGIGVTGVIAPPRAMSPDGTLLSAVETAPERLRAIIAEAGRNLGLFIDNWQWGGDGDPSFAQIPPGPALDSLLQGVREFAGGMPMIATADLASAAKQNFPVRPNIIQGYFRHLTPAGRLWPLAAETFPWLFEPYYSERGLIYPPANLSALAPRPPLDQLEAAARAAARTGSWISVEPVPVRRQGPDAAGELGQLEELMVRAIYASVVSPDVVYLGSLFDTDYGMLRRDASGNDTLETMARPAYLAAGTLAELLEGASYLGRLYLLPPFEAHVFRKSGSDAGIIAIWHNEVRGDRNLSRAEIGTGVHLDQIDWAGNRMPVGGNIPISRVPSFLVGMPASLLLTRMSIRIEPDPPILSLNRRQSQSLEIANHMSRQAPVLVRLRYAARMPDGAMENSWMVQPSELRLNLQPIDQGGSPGRMRFDVSPDSNSQIQHSSPDGTDKSGLKIAQAQVTFNTTPPADVTMFLPFRLTSDIDVDVELLPRENDPNYATLQLKLRWFPVGGDRRRGEIKLTPYYLKRGQMKESSAFPVTVKALPPERRGDPAAPFEAVELRIPRRPQLRTWVGVDEVGGSRYYIADVTDYMNAATAAAEQ